MNDFNSVLDSITKTAGTVKGVLSPNQTAAAPSVTVSVPAQKTNWALIGGIGGGVLLLVVGLIFFTRKK